MIDRWRDAEEMKWAARHWAARVGVKLGQIQVRNMSQKWASMSTSGRLTLNSELLELPKDIGEFVIVHEVLHLIAPTTDRSSRASFMPICPTGWRGRSG
jgi:predicted metal-dependent hydrolase